MKKLLSIVLALLMVAGMVSMLASVANAGKLDVILNYRPAVGQGLKFELSGSIANELAISEDEYGEECWWKENGAGASIVNNGNYKAQADKYYVLYLTLRERASDRVGFGGDVFFNGRKLNYNSTASTFNELALMQCASYDDDSVLIMKVPFFFVRTGIGEPYTYNDFGSTYIDSVSNWGGWYVPGETVGIHVSNLPYDVHFSKWTSSQVSTFTKRDVPAESSYSFIMPSRNVECTAMLAENKITASFDLPHENDAGTATPVLKSRSTNFNVTSSTYLTSDGAYVTHKFTVGDKCEARFYVEGTSLTALDENTKVTFTTSRGDSIYKLSKSSSELYFYIPFTIDHNYQYNRTVNTPTCTSQGLDELKCTYCGELVSKVVPPTGIHIPNDPIPENEVPATCTSKGSYEEVIYCLNCNKELSRETKTTGKTGHSYDDKLTKATLTKDGKIVPTCSVCGATKSATVIAKASGVKLSATKYTFNGKVQKPTLIVKDSNGKAIATSNYTATWSNASSKAVGTYNVKVTFKGNYSGTKTLKYTIVPKQVTGLKNAKAEKTAITINWTKSTGAKYYDVYGSTDGKNFKKVATTDKLTLKVTKVNGKALAAGKTYYFKVRALDSTKKLIGAFSSVLKTGTLTAAPTISKLTSTKSKQATVTWSKVTGAKSYIVYSSTDGKTFKAFKSGITGTSFTLTKLIGGKKIYVKVIAVNAYGAKSAASAVKNVTVKK